jgi:hypothetical protein
VRLPWRHRTKRQRNEAFVVVKINFVKIIDNLVDCHVIYWTLIDRAHQELSNGGAVEIQVIFDRDDPFLAMQKVNFSSHLVDCHVSVTIPLFEAPRGDFNGGAVEIQVIFDRDDPFLAMQKVNFSSLHEEGRPDDALHQSHSIELVNAL